MAQRQAVGEGFLPFGIIVDMTAAADPPMTPKTVKAAEKDRQKREKEAKAFALKNFLSTVMVLSSCYSPSR
jgi:hypothetical protein